MEDEQLRIEELDSLMDSPTRTPVGNTSPVDDDRLKDLDALSPYAQRRRLNRFHLADEDRETWGNFKESRFLSDTDDPTNTAEINEKLASRQPWAAKFGAGVGRVGAKVLTEISKLPGVAGGILAGTAGQIGDLVTGEDNTDFMQTAFNNPWIQAVNDVEHSIKEDVLPVYTSQAIKDGNLIDKIFSIDFWANEGADGLGFIISMLVPGMAINKLGLGAKVVGGANRLNMLGKVDDAANTLKSAGITPKAIDLHASTVANTLFEAGVEAQSAMDGYTEGLEQQLVNGEITKEEFDAQKGKASEIGRNVFAANAAILIGPNAVMSKMLWGGARNKAAGSLFNKGKLIDKLPEVGKVKTLNLWADDFGKAALREGLWEEGMQGAAENYFSDNPNASLTDFVSDLPQAYADMLSTTDGQAAIFLGAAFGGGMQAFTQDRQRAAERKATNDLLGHWQNSANTLDELFGEDVYEKTPTGLTRIKNGQPVINEKAFVEKLKALEDFDTLSTLYDFTVENGDVETAEQIRDLIVTHTIKPYILNEELGLDVLRQHLEASESLIPNTQRVDKGKGTFVSEIMSKAEKMQTAYEMYNEFAPSLVKLTDNEATPEQRRQFYNKLANQYVNHSARRDYLREKLSKVQTLQNDIMKDLAAETVEDAAKTSSRIAKTSKDIKTLESSIKQMDRVLESYWDGKSASKKLKEEVKEEKKQKEAAAKEAEVQSEINEVKNITSQKELREKKKNTTDPAVLQEIDKQAKRLHKKEKAINNGKKEEGAKFAEKKKKEAKKAEAIASNYNVGETVTSPRGEAITITKITAKSIIGTNAEGKQVSFSRSGATPGAPAPVRGVKDNKIKSYDVKGLVQDEKGNKLPFASDAMLDYQLQPRDKRGEEVGFEIDTEATNNPNWAKALKMIEEDDFSDIEFLIDHLPIKAVFSETASAHIETLPRTRKSQEIFQSTARKLREAIIKELAAGTELAAIKTVVAGQDMQPGQPNTEAEYTENLIHQLYHIGGDIENISADDIYVVDKYGSLKNHKGKPFPGSITKDKSAHAGMFFLRVPQANGMPYPLRLNRTLLSEAELDLIFDLVQNSIDDIAAQANEESITYPLISNFGAEFMQRLKEVIPKEMAFFKANKMYEGDLSVKDILDILIFDETGLKRDPGNKGDDIRFKFINDKVMVAGEMFTKEELDRDTFKQLLKLKNKNVIVKSKSKVPNAVQMSNRKYFKYLVESGVFNTNAVTDKPLFTGKANIYIAKDKITVDDKLSKYNAAPRPKGQVKKKPVAASPQGGDLAGLSEFAMNEDTYGSPEGVWDDGSDPITERFGPQEDFSDIAKVNVSKFNIKGLPKPKGQKIVYSPNEYAAIANAIMSGKQIHQDIVIPYKGKNYYVGQGYDVLAVDTRTEQAQLETDVATLKAVFEKFEILSSAPDFGNVPFSMEDAMAAIDKRLAKPAPKPPTKPKDKVDLSKFNIQKQEPGADPKAIIMAHIEKYPTAHKAIDAILRNPVMSEQEKFDRALEYIANNKDNRDSLEEDCSVPF